MDYVKVLIGPEIAKQWHPTKNIGLNPSNISPGSGNRVWWLCRFCGPKLN
ncbi:zinc-ribbon domain-containing protein [Bacillaceae bacterium C204]